MISPNKVGLVLGALIGGWHLVWALLVLINWTQLLFDFIFRTHMIKPLARTKANRGSSSVAAGQREQCNVKPELSTSACAYKSNSTAVVLRSFSRTGERWTSTVLGKTCN